MTDDVIHSRDVNQNPCNMCMPLGAIFPFKGLEQSMVILHGSQGCSTYMRRHIAEHYNEPVDVGSTALNEKGTVYGGEENLQRGLDNIIKVYQPRVIGILTTCLAETIGEDIAMMAAKYARDRGLTEPVLVTVPTPGYGGSHTEGYWRSMRAIVEQLAVATAPHHKINVLVPHISPADIRELKRLLNAFGICYTLFPDISDTLDRPFSRTYTKIPPGGTALADITAMPGAPATIQIGMTAEAELSAGKYLEQQFGVPLYTLPLPIGVEHTDRLIKVLEKLSGRSIPAELAAERGRLIDAMVDSHKYNFQGRAVIYGEPDQVYSVCKLCLENGVHTAVIATGSRAAGLEKLIRAEMDGLNLAETAILVSTDFSEIRARAVAAGANLAVGASDGKYLTEREGIPLVRLGFPIHDRVGGQRILSVGYQGTTQLLDRITNTLLENKHQKYRKSMYDQFYLVKRA